MNEKMRPTKEVRLERVSSASRLPCCKRRTDEDAGGGPRESNSREAAGIVVGWVLLESKGEPSLYFSRPSSLCSPACSLDSSRSSQHVKWRSLSLFKRGVLRRGRWVARKRDAVGGFVSKLNEKGEREGIMRLSTDKKDRVVNHAERRGRMGGKEGGVGRAVDGEGNTVSSGGVRGRRKALGYIGWGGRRFVESFSVDVRTFWEEDADPRGGFRNEGGREGGF